MRRARYFVLSMAMAVAWLVALPPALAADPSGKELLTGAAPEVSRALAGPGGARARIALDALAERGRVKSDDIVKLLDDPQFAGVARRALVALAKVDGVEGVSGVVRRLVKAETVRRRIGPLFELEVAASFGAKQVRGIGVYVDGHEVDVVLRDGTKVEAKYFPGDAEVIGIMLDKAIEQLSLRSQGGKDSVMLVSNRPLTPRQLKAVHRRLGTGAGVVVVDRRGAHTTQVAGRSAQRQRLQVARRTGPARIRGRATSTLGAGRLARTHKVRGR